MAPLDDLAISKGSKILVTGANGYIGTHIIDQFLQLGYKVRAAVRDIQKNTWLVELFQERYGKDSIELTSVVNLSAEGAYDEAVKGVSAMVHVASVVTFDPNPHNVIPTVIDGAVNALKSAYAEPSVKRFVFTSSAVAAVSRAKGKSFTTITEDSWNEDDVKAAWAEPPYNPDRSWPVYTASKTQAEQAIWKFHKENGHKRPDLVVNAILPDLNFGAAVDTKRLGTPSTSAFVLALWNGEIRPEHHMLPPQHFINVQDTARLHIAAAILPHVQSQRIFGFVKPFTWDGIIDIMKQMDPTRKLPDPFANEVDGTIVKPSDKAEQLLRDLGRPGWTSLETTIESNLEGA